MKSKAKKLAAAPPRKRDWHIRQVYHVYQRGSRKQRVFQTRAQLFDYLNLFDRLARRYQVRVHAFCLMSNHVHFLLEPLKKWGISQLMQHLQSHYARSVHRSLGTDGHLWRNHFHCKHIESSGQYRATLLYIEQNPTAAGLAPKAHLYEYSSASAHCANTDTYTLIHQHRRASVNLHLERWHREFNSPTDWANWLRSPRDAAHQADLAEIERILGADRVHPHQPNPLPPCRKPVHTQVAHHAPNTRHGRTRQ